MKRSPKVSAPALAPRTLEAVNAERAGVLAEIGLKTWQRDVLLPGQISGLYNRIQVLNAEAANLDAALPKATTP